MTLKNIIKGTLWMAGFGLMVLALIFVFVKTVSAAPEISTFGTGSNPLPDVPEADCSWMVTEGYVYKSWNPNTDKGIVSHPYYQDFEASCVEPENPITPYPGMPAYLSGCKLFDYQGKAQTTRIYTPPPKPIFKNYFGMIIWDLPKEPEPPPCDCAGHVCFVEINNRYVCEFPLLKDTWGVGTCGTLNLNASSNDKAEVTCMWNGQYQSADPHWTKTEMDIKCPSKKVSRLCNNPAGYCGIIDCADLEGTAVCETRITSTVCDIYCRGHFYIKDTP